MEKRMFRLGLVAICIVGLSVCVVSAQTAASQNPKNRKVSLSKQDLFAEMPDVVAEVNGSKITKQQLAVETLRIYGKEYLARLINRSLIEQECKRQNIQVTQDEINREIKSICDPFNVTVDQLFKQMKEERGVDPQQYVDEFIWTRAALKKLAGSRMTITQAEIEREFESRYGASVQMRQIVAFSREKAENLLKQVMANPTDKHFEAVAKQFSEDTISASMGGLIAPFFRYTLENPNIEKQLFAMQPGQISQIIEMYKGYYVIFYCERHHPPHNIDRAALQKQIAFDVQDKKIQEVSAEVYLQLTRNANVQNAFEQQGDLVQIPEVIATINNQPIYSQTIAEHCAIQHGSMVLADMISRKMLEVECQKRNLQIMQKDLDEEVADLAMKYLLSPDGKPNVQGWIELKCREMNVTPSLYMSNTVWPIVALKKMAENSVLITDEDLQKSYEANFGPKVKCLAIVLENQRKAQEVWALARKNPSEEAFAELAEKYSIEPTSRALRGEMDPIQRHGGMPEIEREAFSLKPGDLSTIIPMMIGTEQRFIVLLCQYYTEPITESLAEVKDILSRDIYEKKLELEMEKAFRGIFAGATIDNYLDGKTIKPKNQPREQIASPPSQRRVTR